MSGSPEGAAITVEPQVTVTSTADDKSQVQAEDTKTTEAATEAETNDGHDQTDETTEKPKKRADGGFQRRINRLTADYRSAEARAEAAEARARELEGKLTKPSDAGEPKAPRESDYASYEEFRRAELLYVADVTRRNTLKEQEEQRKADDAKAKKEAEVKRFTDAKDRFDKAADSVADHYEDFDDVMDRFWRGQLAFTKSNEVAEYLIEVSDRGPELAYYLDANPKEADRILSLPRLAQVRELAKLEATIPAVGAKNVTKAPPPPKSVGSRGGSDTKDPEKMSIDEMRKATGTHRKVDY